MAFRNANSLLSTSFLATAVFLFLSCSTPEVENTVLTPNVLAPESAANTPVAEDTATTKVATPVVPADAATILTRKQVPILCYHQIRDWRANDSKSAKAYIVPEDRFKEQIKMLADSGYQTILPDQLLAYLNYGTPLPSKPIMLTFDDTNLDQFTVAAPELEKYGFKGVFFVMTVSLGRPRYMSKAQVKELADAGHEIGSHTWDHHNVKKYKGNDWVTQVEKPSRQLAEITGKEIKYFAYPFGLWNAEAIPELKSRGMVAAFQLAGKYDEQDPLYSIRRIIASGYWSAKSLHSNMVNSFD
ncbi:polysaccharide deacetylase family protein [Pontibacter harenae]|uniref:polysaccharide deacetylase family protein n=1 Tax=Pontibacter harenae TaxID=2894083 RepID=UPI001E615C4A|nr:polysaccharide deacetylase family protein [Pontibacter harenae]MCC9166944.1 polysaccharide deacetylase family protein [Pontibacter harenae]